MRAVLHHLLCPEPTDVSLTRRVERNLHAVRSQIQHPLHRAGGAAHHERIHHFLNPLETAPGAPSALRWSLRLFALVPAVVECARALYRRPLFLANLAGHLLGLATRRRSSSGSRRSFSRES